MSDELNNVMMKENMTPYRLVALDLDGTLVDDKKRLLPSTISAVMTIQQMGIKVVLASGRPTYGCRAVAKTLHLDEYGGYILSYNGGKLTSMSDGKILARRALQRKQLPFLYEATKRYPNLAIISYSQQEIVTETPEHQYVLEEQWADGGMPIRGVPNFLEALDRDPLKVAVAGDTNTLFALKEELEQHYGEQLNIILSNDHYLDVVPRGVDKGSTLEFLLEELNLDRSQLMAVGDSHNDLGMIQVAGLGVAMANATEAVKRSADYVTTGNNSDGIAHLLNKFIINPAEQNVADLNVELLNQMMEGGTLMSTLGIKCTRLEEGYVECTMPVDSRTQQPMGILHGGASLALAETAAGYGSLLLLRENEIQVGMQVSGNHISSAHTGDTVTAVGSIIHRGRSSHVWNIDILSSRGKLISSIRVINSILNKR